ncbi:hypothetical protein FLL57_10915 [Rhodopseudomonas palustris]|uniref:hypothetical protein n=1 Tax=Rhodopseudomonas palustris TaxID=1076 RepID=UPI00115E8201|nr:hypothetical protein [Rhodopseudomonas palustris]QDL97786.1 hypothetical protein FLL57_10915 [Rhodopseudomonas palustris]
MRLSHRLIPVVVLVALSGGLSGCGSMSGFDPTDMFDFLDQKKKLQGERRPVFPEGVPGLEQGVPRSLYKDQVEQQQREQAAAVAAPVEGRPPPAARTRTRQTTATRRPAAAEPAAEEEGGAAAVPPAPPPAKQSRRRITTPPPDDQPAASSAPAQQSGTAPAFPAPLPSGSFQR